LTVSYGSSADPRIIGSFNPRSGGRELIERFAQFCKNRNFPVRLVSENRAKYSIWEEGDGVVWYEKKLTPNMPQALLNKEVAQATKKFFSLAPVAMRTLLAP
jgi:hypothetical protein